MPNPLRKKAEDLAKDIFCLRVDEPFDPKGNVYMSYHSENQAAVILEAALLSVREETIRECAKAICSDCKNNRKFDSDGHHPQRDLQGNTYYVTCEAIKIHRLKSGAAQKEGQ